MHGSIIDLSMFAKKINTEAIYFIFYSLTVSKLIVYIFTMMDFGISFQNREQLFWTIFYVI